jgi:hypothetical protein
MKNIVKLHMHFFPLELDQAIPGFLAYYNNKSYHESLDNMMLADVFDVRARE